MQIYNVVVPWEFCNCRRGASYITVLQSTSELLLVGNMDLNPKWHGEEPLIRLWSTVLLTNWAWKRP